MESVPIDGPVFWEPCFHCGGTGRIPKLPRTAQTAPQRGPSLAGQDWTTSSSKDVDYGFPEPSLRSFGVA